MLNGTLTGNYITLNHIHSPKLKEKPAQSLTSFDLLKHKIILANGRHKGPCNLCEMKSANDKILNRLMISCCHEILLMYDQSLSAQQ